MTLARAEAMLASRVAVLSVELDEEESELVSFPCSRLAFAGVSVEVLVLGELVFVSPVGVGVSGEDVPVVRVALVGVVLAGVVLAGVVVLGVVVVGVLEAGVVLGALGEAPAGAVGV